VWMGSFAAIVLSVAATSSFRAAVAISGTRGFVEVRSHRHRLRDCESFPGWKSQILHGDSQIAIHPPHYWVPNVTKPY
jgi:hypothetical protein